MPVLGNGLNDPVFDAPYIVQPHPSGKPPSVFERLELEYKKLETTRTHVGVTNSCTMSREDIDSYLKATGDDNEIHQQQGIVPGVFLLGKVSTLLKGALPLKIEGAAMIYGAVQDTVFLGLVLVDDDVELEYKLSHPFIFENNLPAISVDCAFRVVGMPEYVMTCKLHLRFIEDRKWNVALINESRKRRRLKK